MTAVDRHIEFAQAQFKRDRLANHCRRDLKLVPLTEKAGESVARLVRSLVGGSVVPIEITVRGKRAGGSVQYHNTVVLDAPIGKFKQTVALMISELPASNHPGPTSSQGQECQRSSHFHRIAGPQSQPNRNPSFC